MKSKTVKTHSTGLSFSAVLIWKNGLNSLPPLSQDFCKTIFGDKIESAYTLGRNGINVSTPAKFQSVNGELIQQVVPFFQFGFDRMVITHPELSGFIDAYDRIVKEINNLSFQSILTVDQMGINIEYEVTFETGHVQTHLNNRFQTPDKNEHFVTSSIGEVKLVLVESPEEMKLVSITIQPRLSKSNAFYIKSNDHYSKIPNQTFLSTEELVKYFNESLKKFESKVLPSLDLFRND